MGAVTSLMPNNRRPEAMKVQTASFGSTRAGVAVLGWKVLKPPDTPCWEISVSVACPLAEGEQVVGRPEASLALMVCRLSGEDQ